MNFYIGNSIADINIDDCNVELDDDFVQFIYWLKRNTDINVDLLLRIDPYDDIVIDNSELPQLLEMFNNILYSLCLTPHNEHVNYKEVFIEIINFIKIAISESKNVVSIGD